MRTASSPRERRPALPSFLSRAEALDRAHAFACSAEGRRWLRAEIRCRRIETAAWAALLIAATITGATMLRLALSRSSVPVTGVQAAGIEGTAWPGRRSPQWLDTIGHALRQFRASWPGSW